MTSKPASRGETSLDSWREQIADRAFRVFVVVCGATLAPALWLFAERGKLVAQGGVYVALFAVSVALARHRNVAYRTRAAILSLTFVAAGVSAFLSHGFVSDARVVLVTASVFATVLLGARWGIVLSGATVLLFALGGLGVLHVPSVAPFARLSTAAIATMQVLFVVFSAAGVIPIAYVLRRCERALDEERDALARARAATHAAEEAVRELERGRGLLESIVENTPDLVYVKDKDGRYELVNEAFAAVVGVSPEDLRGKTIDELVSNDISERMRAIDARILATGESVHTHEPGRPPTRYLVLRFPIRSTDGEIRGVGGIATDLTELEERAKLAEESEARHRAIFEGIWHGVLVTTGEGDIVEMNAGAARLFGIPREELRATSPRLFGTGLELPSALPPEVFSSTHVAGSGTLESRWERPDGVAFDAELRFAELPLQEGPRILWIVRDVSPERSVERRRRAEQTDLEARVVSRTRELEATNLELSAFSYTVSHDLRAPLRQVTGYVRLFQEHLERTQNTVDTELYAELGEVKDAAEGMARLIDALLRAARTTRTQGPRSEP